MSPKILIVDIETSPLISYTWDLFDQNISLNQLVEDWHLLSYAAKWLGEKAVFYQDQSKAKDIRNDKELLKGIWKLMDEADIVLGQNSKSFDTRKLNARFILSGMKPPSSYKQIDTLQIAKKAFKMTSNKLEYLSNKLNVKYKKLTHKEFAGFELWKECLKGNKAAWKEMKTYNIHDVLATEELYTKLQPWDTSYNPNIYSDSTETICGCGSKDFVKNGFAYTSLGKFPRFQCRNCGAEIRLRTNQFDQAKIRSLAVRVK